MYNWMHQLSVDLAMPTLVLAVVENPSISVRFRCLYWRGKTWRMGSQDLDGYVVHNHYGSFLSPKDRVVGPLPNGRTSWLINGGDSNHQKTSWDGRYWKTRSNQLLCFLETLYRGFSKWNMFYLKYWCLGIHGVEHWHPNFDSFLDEHRNINILYRLGQFKLQRLLNTYCLMACQKKQLSIIQCHSWRWP